MEVPSSTARVATAPRRTTSGVISSRTRPVSMVVRSTAGVRSTLSATTNVAFNTAGQQGGGVWIGNGTTYTPNGARVQFNTPNNVYFNV